MERHKRLHREFCEITRRLVGGEGSAVGDEDRTKTISRALGLSLLQHLGRAVPGLQDEHESKRNY